MELLPVPFEIRRFIYTELLVCDRHISFRRFDREQNPFGLDRDCRALGLHPAILGVNKATNAEAAAILYAQNRFHLFYAPHEFPKCPDLEPFFRQIGAANAKLLRHLCLQLVALIQEIEVGDDWKLALLPDDEETVELIHRYCPGLGVCELWLDPQCGDPRKRLSIDQWQQGAASIEKAYKRLFTIDKFVIVYSIRGSGLEKCPTYWQGYENGLFCLSSSTFVSQSSAKNCI